MMISILLGLLAIYEVSGAPKFVSYIGQAGSGWGQPATNEEFLKVIGVPEYGGSKGYTHLNFAFWVSNSGNGGAAINGGAFDWQNILQRVTSSSLRSALTGTSNPTANQLRQGIKAKYASEGIKILISAFGGNDHPMNSAKSASQIGSALAQYAKDYLYDGVDVDWEEAFSGKFAAGAGGETWLCQLTDSLKSNLNSNQLLTHAPQAPYFMGSTGGQYPNGGYNRVHQICGNKIDWYNVQFYNQGGTTYNSYSGLFQSSIGWSGNSGVYQIMDGAAPERVSVPGDKIVVGKHTSGDGSTFVSGSALKSIFNSALSAGRWKGGFMTWQFYKEVYPSSGGALITSVLQANWGVYVPPTASTTARPTSPSGGGGGGGCTTTTRCGSTWSDANGKCGQCCSYNGDCTADSSSTRCYAHLSANPCSGTQPQPTPPPTPRPNSSGGGCTSTTRCGSSWGDANGKCGQCCSYNGDCTADWSSRLCYAHLSASPCSGAYKADDNNDENISWTVWFAMSVFILLAIGIIVGIIVYKKRMHKGKGYVSNKEKEMDTVELRENDGNNTVQTTEMIEVNNESEEEIEISLEVEAETPITT